MENSVIIHGHHPHQIQGIKLKNGSLIAYSLGNALFDKTISMNGLVTVELNEENRKSFLLGVEIVDGKIVGFETKGFYIANEYIIPFDVIPMLEEISNPLNNNNDETDNQNKRQEQYMSVLNEKFGKHDIKLLKSRLNYYSIGAKITSIIRGKKYQILKRFF